MAVRRGLWAVSVLLSAGAVLFSAVAASGVVPAVRSHPHASQAKIPKGAAGVVLAVAAVPHSSDVWALAESGSVVGSDHFYELRRHHGHVERIKPPKLNGEYGGLLAITASSPTSIWLAGATEQGHGSIDDFPAIWRWSGGKFVAQKLPPLQACACLVSSISASSPSNVWAAGVIYSKADAPMLLHFNGKKWSAVPDLISQGGTNRSVVSTSGPDNAWEAAGPGFAHWNGKAWAVDGTAPAEDSFTGMATSSPKLAYAVGANDTTRDGVILKYNGSTWSKVTLPDAQARKGQLSSIAMHGTSAWAVGTSANAHRVRVPVILHTTGGKWKAQGAPWRGVGLSAVSAQSGDRAAVAGYYESFNSRATKTFVAIGGGHWTGINT